MDSNVAFLASDVGRLFRKRLEMSTRDLGITGPSWRALAHIRGNPGINQQSLAALLEVEAMTVARMIDRLEKQNLVERRPDPTDRRAWLLYLAPGAESELNALRDRAEVIIQQSTEMFTPQELDLLVSLLKRMRERLLEPSVQIPEPAQYG